MCLVHLLKRANFDATVDHLALVHILKSKTEPATTRIKRLLEVLSAYSFNLYYMKAKDMISSNFLSRQITDRSNPHEIIPISCDMQAVLKDRYYNVGSDNKYLIQMHSQAKASEVKLPEVHGVVKGLDPNMKPERQIIKSANLTTQLNPQRKPRLGQGRDRSWKKIKCPYTSANQVQSKDVSQTREQTLSKQKEGTQTPLTKQTTDRHIEQRPETGIMPEHTIRPKVTETQIPIYPDPLMKPPPRLPDLK